jgi:hypothetical protein
MAPKKLKPIRIEGNVAYVPLTKGYEAIIDADDVPLVEGWSWSARIKANTVYACRSGQRPSKAYILLHRSILGLPVGVICDHRDGNGLNNRRKNLRIASTAENTRNQRRASHNTSGVKGVSLDATSGKWRAMIRAGGKQKNLGRFFTLEAAARAYAKASAELHGEFGRLE